MIAIGPKRRKIVLTCKLFARARARILTAAVLLLAGAALASADDGLSRAIGEAMFVRQWVPAPSTTKVNDGLGPLFNARACVQCHAAAGGGTLALTPRGTLADRGGVVRLSDAEGNPDPIYGAQIQTRAIQGQAAEAAVAVTWETSAVELPGNMRVELRRPVIELKDLRFGPLAPQTRASLLLAPSLAITATIARVAPQPGTGTVFGRKANEPDIAQAAATAFARDLGLSTAHKPDPAGDCTTAQTACRQGPHGDDTGTAEIDPQILSALVSYLESFKPLRAARLSGDAQGASIFGNIGCASCHQPEHPGRDGRPVVLYSDLKRHDMGPELSGVAEAGAASATQWRTAPLLWIGSRLHAGSTLLHDGRARTVEEAVLWHGGEAQAARDAFRELEAEDRAALVRYVLER